MYHFILTSDPVATTWLQTICFINLFMFVMLYVSTARYVKAIVLCTIISDTSLSKYLQHTQLKGGNFALLSICRGLRNRRSVWLIIWHQEKHLLIIQS